MATSTELKNSILGQFCSDIATSSSNPNAHTVFEATVITGLENVAKDECFEKFGLPVTTAQGRIYFAVSSENDFIQALDLRSVEHVLLVVAHFETVDLSETQWKTSLHGLAEGINWSQHLDKWNQLKTNIASGKKENTDTPQSPVKELSYRVSCNRAGDNHSFESREAAWAFGGKINDIMGWKVDLSNFDLEVVLNIVDNQVYVCMAVTDIAMHKRNVAHLGLTTLKATLSYNMLRLSEINAGDVICDPMCGSGAIPLEAASCWPQNRIICGDSQLVATDKTALNVECFNQNRIQQNLAPVPIEVFQWDATNLPLLHCSIDVIVTDLPFGKRMGSLSNNSKLYPKFFKEASRVIKPDKGRMVLLTRDKKNISLALQSSRLYWKQMRMLHINMGGLIGCVYLFKRTAEAFLTNCSKSE